MFDQVKLAIAAVVGLSLLLSGIYLGYRFEAGKVAELQLQYAQAETKAREEAASIQKAADDINTTAAVQEATNQAAISTLTVQTLKEITTYVPAQALVIHSVRDCIPYGLVRVLDAASSGRDPGALQLPAGLTDDACAPIDAAALVASIVTNYGAARANAEQLNTLILNLQQLAKAEHPNGTLPGK